MSFLRLAVIGAGHLGRIHTRLLESHEQIAVAGVVDPNPKACQSVSDEFGVPAYSHHLDLANQIDAAIIATPTVFHHQVALDLIGQGVHTLIEKPLTHSVQHADALVRAAAEQNVVLQVGHVERFRPALSSIKPHLRDPYFFEASRTSAYTGRSTDIGVVLDLMIHDLDVVLSLVQQPVVEVEAVGSTVIGPHEDMAHARLRFANGCTANLHASRVSPQATRTMKAYTAEYAAAIDFSELTASLLPLRDTTSHATWQSQATSGQNAAASASPLELPWTGLTVKSNNPILEEQRNFLDCIRSSQAPRVTGQQARDAVAICQQITRQIQSNQLRKVA